MATIEEQVTLIVKKNQTEDVETPVFAELYPVGRDEFGTAGQRGFKPSFRVDIWGFEYENQQEILIDGKKLAIYRTYGPKANGKIELYVAERVGKG